MVMMVIKTILKGPNGEGYLAVEAVEGFPGHVRASGLSRPDAIAACMLKKEAHDAARERRQRLQISLECAVA